MSIFERPNEDEEFSEGADCDCHDYPPPGPWEEEEDE